MTEEVVEVEVEEEEVQEGQVSEVSERIWKVARDIGPRDNPMGRK